MFARVSLTLATAAVAVLAVGLGAEPVPVLAAAIAQYPAAPASDDRNGDQRAATPGSVDVNQPRSEIAAPAPATAARLPSQVQGCEPSADSPGMPVDGSTGRYLDGYVHGYADGALNSATGDADPACLPPFPPPPSGSGSRLNVPVVPAAIPHITTGPQLYFTSDFEDGFADWGICQNKDINGGCSGLDPKSESLQIIPRTDAPEGSKAARFVVDDGDTTEFGGERSELSDDNAGATVHEGDERWYEWSMRVASNFPEPKGDWFIVMQWHGDHGSPPLAIDLSKGTVDIGGDGVDAPRKTIGPIRRGEWVNYVMHVRFSQQADKGFVEAWENGHQSVQKASRATMTGDTNYLKMGIYRDATRSGRVVIDFDNLRISGPPNQGGVQLKLRNQPEPVGPVRLGLRPAVPDLRPDVTQLLPKITDARGGPL